MNGEDLDSQVAGASFINSVWNVMVFFIRNPLGDSIVAQAEVEQVVETM